MNDDDQPVDETGQPIPTPEPTGSFDATANDVPDPAPSEFTDAPEVTPPSELKGAALAQALDDAGLPKTGTADEKRASLAGTEPGDAEEVAIPGLAMAAPAYSPPKDFEHTAFNPDNVQHIS